MNSLPVEIGSKIIDPIHIKSLPNIKLGKVIICFNLVLYILTCTQYTMFVHVSHYITTIDLYLA